MENPDHLKRYGRVMARLVKLGCVTSLACLDFLCRRLFSEMDPRRRAAWLSRWCAVLLPRIGVRIEVEGALPSEGLLVSNHLGYLDILVYSAVASCGFVAKKEVRSWPIYGWMASMGGTVFIDRERASDTLRASEELRSAIANKALMMLFPEGTSTDGAQVLPFRPALFEAPVRAGVPIAAAYLRYSAEGGSVERQVCYWGDMTFGPHLLGLLQLRTITAHIAIASEGKIYSDRKDAATTTQRLVEGLRQETILSETVAQDRATG